MPERHNVPRNDRQMRTASGLEYLPADREIGSFVPSLRKADPRVAERLAINRFQVRHPDLPARHRWLAEGVVDVGAVVGEGVAVRKRATVRRVGHVGNAPRLYDDLW